MRCFFLFIIALVCASCENELKEVNSIASKEMRLPIEISKNVELIYSDSAIVKARLRSPVLKYIKVASPYYEMPVGLHIDFFNPTTLAVESTLDSKYGIRYPNGSLVEVRNQVVVINSKGERLDTERLIWNEKTGKIYTDKFVKITRATEVLYGDGLETTQDFRKYRIMKLRGTLNIKDAPGK